MTHVESTLTLLSEILDNLGLDLGISVLTFGSLALALERGGWGAESLFLCFSDFDADRRSAQSSGGRARPAQSLGRVWLPP